MNDCICSALFTNLDCKKHARPYLLSLHRALPGAVVRLEILAAAFKHEDYFGNWPNTLLITESLWQEFLEDPSDPPDYSYDYKTFNYTFLSMDVEFIPKGDLRVANRRYA